MVARVGEQTDCAYALVNRRPRSASASRVGIGANVVPGFKAVLLSTGLESMAQSSRITKSILRSGATLWLFVELTSVADPPEGV